MSNNCQKGDSSDWDEVSYVIRSRYRVAVLRELHTGPLTPSRIAKEADFRLAHISRALQQLRARELVELLVSEDQTKGRVYGITNIGTETWSVIDKKNLS